MPQRIAPILLVLASLSSRSSFGDDPPPAKGGAKLSEEKPAGEKKAPLPEIPREKLPPRTAEPPDPSREQYRRESVFVRVEESVETKDGKRREISASEDRIVERYLADYFRRSGFEVVKRPEEAALLFEGKFAARFQEAIVFQGLPIAHKYSGTVQVSLKKGKGSELVQNIEIPDFTAEGLLRPNEPEDRAAVLKLRRRISKVIWDRLQQGGPAARTLGDPEVEELINSLALDDIENEAPADAKVILKKLVEKRFAAVPSLLEALTDDRPVKVIAHYPGVTAATAEKLRIFHLADKALEEIFQKVSRLDLETPEEKRFFVIKGWENEWGRFCPPFREALLRRQEEAQKHQTQGKPAPGAPDPEQKPSPKPAPEKIGSAKPGS